MEKIGKLIFEDEGFRAGMEDIALAYITSREAREVTKGGIYTAFYRADEERGLIVISHGFSEGLYKYREFIYIMLREGLSVLAFDHRGHGHSPKETTNPHTIYIDSFDTYIKDLGEVTRMASGKAGGKPMYLYGHSMGGCIAALFTERQGGIYRKVILSSPMIGIKLAEGAMAPIARIIAGFMCLIGKEKGQLPGSDEEEKFEDSLATCRERWAYVQDVRRADEAYITNRPSYGWTRAALKASSEVMAGVERIDTPVLLIEAKEDTMVSVKAEEKFAERSAMVHLERLDGCRHEIILSPRSVLLKYYSFIFSFLDSD